MAVGKQTYIITGAAGHLGSTLIRCLLAGDPDVDIHGLILPDEEPVVRGKNVAYFRGDICNPGSLEMLLTGSQVQNTTVIHTAALITIADKVSERLYEVNVGGVKNIVEFCRSNHLKRLVHVSSVHALPELPGNSVIREISEFSADKVIGAYAKTKAEGAALVQNAMDQGLDAVMVFPSGILGPYDLGRNHLIQMAVDYMQGRLPACVHGGYDFVDVRDVAVGCLKAAACGRAGQGYILSGHYMTIENLLATIGKYCGRKPVPCIPMWLARAAAPLVEGYAGLIGKRALFTRYSLHTVTSNSIFSNEKAQKELNWCPRPMEETVRDMTEWLSGNTGLNPSRCDT